MNRRMPNGMYGGVRGGFNSPYSIGEKCEKTVNTVAAGTAGMPGACRVTVKTYEGEQGGNNEQRTGKDL